MSENGKNPLHRWSERKAKARREEALASEEQPVAVVEGEDVVEGEENEPAKVAVEDLPDIDSLDADSDYTVFMGEGVPETLKKLALRKLWRSDPVLANVDGLVDYGEDFTVSDRVGDAVKTIYRVGKGLMTDEEVEDEKLGEDEAEVAQSAPEDDNEPADKSRIGHKTADDNDNRS